MFILIPIIVSVFAFVWMMYALFAEELHATCIFEIIRFIWTICRMC